MYINCLLSEPVGDFRGPDVKGESIIIRMDLTGIRCVQIIADDSAQEARLRGQLETVRPILEVLHTMMKVER
jgi:hypothetical protein